MQILLAALVLHRNITNSLLWEAIEDALHFCSIKQRGRLEDEVFGGIAPDDEDLQEAFEAAAVVEAFLHGDPWETWVDLDALVAAANAFGKTRNFPPIHPKTMFPLESDEPEDGVMWKVSPQGVVTISVMALSPVARKYKFFQSLIAHHSDEEEQWIREAAGEDPGEILTGEEVFHFVWERGKVVVKRGDLDLLTEVQRRSLRGMLFSLRMDEKSIQALLESESAGRDLNPRPAG